MQIDLTEVYSSKHKNAFHQFTRDLYAQDKEFISHLDVDIEAIFDSQQNSEFQNGDARRWLAYQNGQVVGKVAAFYNAYLDTDAIESIGLKPAQPYLEVDAEQIG